MVWLFWCLLLSHGAFCSDLSSTDIYQSAVYASSVQRGSRAEFAVDDDLLDEKPTCFQTDDDQPDPNGLHWLLVDFGYTLQNVKEIRIVTENGYNLSEISAYTLRKPNLSLQQLVNISNAKDTLDFESADVSLCSSTGPVEPWRTATTIQCDQPRNGRWLALRRSEGMHICMVNVYVTQAHSTCFVYLRLEKLARRLEGVFRLIRHLTLGSCRAACMNSSECDGVLYVQRNRYSGNCHLTRPALERGVADAGVEQMVDRRVAAICQQNTCRYEGNRCHAGRRFNLTKKASPGESDSMKTHLLVDSSQESSEDWLVSLGNSSFYAAKHTPRYLVSIQFSGQLSCTHWDCGSIRVTTIDATGFKTTCSSIKTIEVQQLDKLPVLCEPSGDSAPTNITTVRITWRTWHKTTSGGMAKLTVNISGGHVRLSPRPLPPKRMESPITIAPIVPLIKIKTTLAVKDLKSSELNDDDYAPLVYPTQLEQLTVIPPQSMTSPDAPSFTSSAENSPVIDSLEFNERGNFVNDNRYESKQHQLYIEPEESRIATEDNGMKPYGKRGVVEKSSSGTSPHKQSDGSGATHVKSPIMLIAAIGISLLLL